MKPAISVFIVITTIIALIEAQPTTTHNACTVSTYSCGMLEQKLKKMEAMLLSIAMGDETDLSRQLSSLRATVEKLEAAIAKESPVYSSCKEIRISNSSSSSGEYTIRTTTGRILDKVYCEMGLNGGGYTFLNPKDLPSLTNDEVQAMFTDQTNFLMRVRRSDTTQPYGVLEQLPQFQNVSLMLGLNENPGYQAPVNVNYLGENFLYFGFLPTSMAANLNQQGIRVNGRDIVFTHCPPVVASEIALWPNFAERTPGNALFDVPYPFCINLFNYMKANPSGRLIPAEYFMFLEAHYGGCGCFAQTDGRASVNGTLAASIGFR